MKLLSSGITILIPLLVFTTQASAVQIAAGAFGPGAVVESFEGLTPGPNLTLPGPWGYMEPGVIGPFAFASGVSFTNPVPNPGFFAGSVFIGDWAIGSAVTNIPPNGSILNAGDVPFGSAFIALNGPAPGGPIEFTFPSDMLRAGAYVTGVSANITMSAYDVGGNLLETQALASVNVAAWGTNFLGIENPAGIRRITISGDNVVLDGLTFEAAPAVPASIPTLSEWGMIIFSLLLGAIAIRTISRKHQEELI